MFFQAVQQVVRVLESMDRWFDKATQFAEERSFDPSVFLTARLAPDQYDFTRQVQAACDAAKFLAARASGRDAPVHPDTEADGQALRARIRAVISYLQSFDEADFAGAEARVVPLNFMPGKGLLATEYATQLALPNFYFHVVTAYSILRHNGVKLGKTDFITSLPLLDL
ncbi:MAG: DUF1993 domain-containing protein [Polyangiales bacterium]